MKKERDIILLVVITLICVGMVMIYSASSIYAYEKMGDSTYFLKKHLLYICLGAVLFILTLLFPYKKLRSYLPFLILTTYFLLGIVLIPDIGIRVGGARRWIDLGVIQFQPFEIAKLVLIIYLARFVARKGNMISSFRKGFFPPLVVCFSMAGLILLQPDLGGAIFLIVVTVIILIVAGIDLKYLAGLICASIPAAYFFIYKVPYRRERIIGFLNPWSFPRGCGFQLVQSYLAFGTGGIFGRGLGQSKQKLFYLPASHTDFIFSIVGEELGFIGVAFIITLFITLLICGFKIVFKLTETFPKVLALGIVVNITLQVILNIAVTTGLLPTKGLPLPFLSYGGSNLIINIVQIGLLLNLSKNAN